MKKCGTCGIGKSLSSFYKSLKSTLGVSGVCKSCYKERALLNISKIDNKQCVECKETKEVGDFSVNYKAPSGLHSKCKTCSNKRQREIGRNAPENRMLHAANWRSKRDNIVSNIKLEDIVIPEKCPVLGIPLFSNKGRHCDNSPTIDRIIPKLGYIKSNIVVISYRANFLKSNASLEELKALVRFYDGS